MKKYIHIVLFLSICIGCSKEGIEEPELDDCHIDLDGKEVNMAYSGLIGSFDYTVLLPDTSIGTIRLSSLNDKRLLLNSSTSLYNINIFDLATGLLIPIGKDNRGKMDWNSSEKIVFSGNGFQLYTIESDGTNLRQLTNRPGVRHLNPIWSPDGKKICFHQHTGSFPNHNIICDADGNYLDTVDNPSNVFHKWQSDSIILGMDRILFVNLQTKMVEYIPVDMPASNSTAWGPNGEIIYTAEGSLYRYIISSKKIELIRQRCYGKYFWEVLYVPATNKLIVKASKLKKISHDALQNFFAFYEMDTNGNNEELIRTFK